MYPKVLKRLFTLNVIIYYLGKWELIRAQCAGQAIGQAGPMLYSECPLCISVNIRVAFVDCIDPLMIPDGHLCVSLDPL